MRRISNHFLQILALVSASTALTAATPHDNEIELVETTYRVNADNSADITYHQRWRALTAQGRANLTQVRFPYSSASQELEIKFIRTLKKGGAVVDGDPAGAFDSPPSTEPLAPYFSDEKLKTLIPPNLETGDAVEYEAVLHIRKWAKAGDFWLSHELAAHVRVLSEFVVLDLPADRKVGFYEDPAHPGTTETTAGRRIERWSASNPDPEKASMDAADPLFIVSSVSSWDALGEWIRSMNQTAAVATPEIAVLAARLIANQGTEQERIAALYSYVATKVRYVGVDYGLGFQPHPASAVLHNAYGDCKDQSALLSALLASAGFNAHPVLTTPGIGVRVPSVAAPQFTHQFTAVETKAGLIFLDTSMGPVAPQVLGEGVRGRSALLVGDSKSSIIEIPAQSPVMSKVTQTTKGRVTAAGVFEGSTRFELQGLMEVGMRRVFLDSTDAEKEVSLRELAGPTLATAVIRQVQSADPNDLTKPFWIQCELSDKDFFPQSKTSAHIGSEPPAAWLASLGATQSRPTKPVPVEKFVMTDNLDLIVDTALITTNGMPVHLNKPFGSFDSEYTYERGHLLRSQSFKLNGPSIAPSDWSDFLEFIQSTVLEHAKGFTLERRTGTPSIGISDLNRLRRDGSDAYRRRDYEGSKQAYLQATKLDPQSKTAWNDLGLAYAALHDYEKAAQAYKRQIEVNPGDMYAYNNLGLVYRTTNRNGDAIAMFRKQIAINPRDNFAHGNLALSLERENRWEEARTEAAISSEISPEDAVKLTRLGTAQLKTGRFDEGRESYAKALALVHDSMTENNIAYELANAGIDLDHASALIFGMLGSEARQICQPENLSKGEGCAAQLSRLAIMLDTAGWVLYRRADFKGAEPYLRSAYAITPRGAESIHLSATLAKLGRLDEALKCFAELSSESNFDRMDSKEARSELAKAAGGEAQLNVRVKQIQNAALAAGSKIRVLALVDERGKVTEVKSADAPDSLLKEARSVTLLPIAWLEYSFRSIRTIEFRQEGEKWILTQSYVGPGSAVDPAPAQ